VSWAAIIGQPLANRLLRHAVSSGKVAHAYLFVGPEGVGKRTVALELAKALNCLAPLADGSACDACVSCRKLTAVPPVHPDLETVAPDGRFIKTDQVRELQAHMYARPNEGKVRVAIIDGADRMNAESGNRLLKLLEEPPAYAVLLLLTHNLSGVLSTLISRCQVVNFTPLSPDEVAGALQTQLGLDAGQARLFASLSGGSIGRAAQLVQDPGVSQRRDDTSELLQRIHELDDFDLLGRAEALEKQKEHLEDWLELLTVWLRDTLLMAQTGSPQLIINADRLPVVKTLARRHGAASLLTMLAAVTDARGQLQRNANTRLVLDVLLLRLGDASQLEDTATI
jgi:DNA polymerase III subunit delta'